MLPVSIPYGKYKTKSVIRDGKTKRSYINEETATYFVLEYDNRLNFCWPLLHVTRMLPVNVYSGYIVTINIAAFILLVVNISFMQCYLRYHINMIVVV